MVAERYLGLIDVVEQRAAPTAPSARREAQEPALRAGPTWPDGNGSLSGCRPPDDLHPRA
jgi:hypothetical protein